MTTTTARPVITRDQAATILGALGFNVRTTGLLSQAVRVFQQSFRLLDHHLDVDDKVGPDTTAALLLAEARRRAKQSTWSEHFSYAEVACKCRGKYPACRGVFVVGELVDALEKLRASDYRDGLIVVSGYRCVGRNAEPAIGGAGDSQHLHGAACDVAPRLKWTTLRDRHQFSGVGYSPRTGLVCHVDVRHASEHKTGATLAHPDCFPDGK